MVRASTPATAMICTPTAVVGGSAPFPAYLLILHFNVFESCGIESRLAIHKAHFEAALASAFIGIATDGRLPVGVDPAQHSNCQSLASVRGHKCTQRARFMRTNYDRGKPVLRELQLGAANLRNAFQAD